MRKAYYLLAFYLLHVCWSQLPCKAQAPGQKLYVSEHNGFNYFPLSVSANSAPLYTDTLEYPGVKRAVNSLKANITSVTGASSKSANDSKSMVIIGTLGKNAQISQLIANRKLDVKAIAGKWEAHITQVIKDPFPGIKQALIIAGSDKRGTIYGVYDLSAQIGVSPWNWWADVPVRKSKSIYVLPGKYTDSGPAVKYRGIFINDEAPAFSGWATEKFGGVNHKVYEKVFELILRLKGNYLWPAMWGNAFNDDDKLDPVLADEYGIVMGTSHHEPMDRAQQEWKRYGQGEWNYRTNKDVLQNFWRKGIENMGNRETLVTVGMRGDGDMPMEQSSNIALLETIVKDQRKIISDVTGKDAAQTPQMWALYKEVQDYYDKGMRVPDDVTLLLCDDNWGNIRKLPVLNQKPRKGGYGIYFHFDYVGDPRNYKWLNTTNTTATWEQMHLAYEYNARQVWVVNVGDLKPMEYPISFFLDYAWNPDKWPANRLPEYSAEWAKQQFGPVNANKIASILNKYTMFNSRRKPELLNGETYSLVNYNEFERIVNEYNKLKEQAENLYTHISPSYKDAYYQLVLHPVIACANLNEMYLEAAKNKWYTVQRRAAVNTTAARIRALYEKDAQISRYYNDTLAGGKWKHLMDQTHIGYTYWQQPDVNKMPGVTEIVLPNEAEMGAAVEGSAKAITPGDSAISMPELYPGGPDRFIEIFNRGKAPFSYSAISPASFVAIKYTGRVTDQKKIWISVDWSKAPANITQVPVTITGPGGKIRVNAIVNNQHAVANAFNEHDGYIAIEAAHYSKAADRSPVKWQVIPNYGRTLSGVTPVPVTTLPVIPGGNGPHLEYNINLNDTSAISVYFYISPTLDFKTKKSLNFGVSIDDDKPQLVNIIKEMPGDNDWKTEVANNIKKLKVAFSIKKPGQHLLKYWMADPGIVLQKLVIDTGGLKDSYLGPPEQ